MKCLNKKGMTLTELLVSVVLISVIMIFMYKLVSDVRAEKRNTEKLTDNILKISEVEVEWYNKIYSELPKTLSLVGIWNDIWLKNDKKTIDSHYINFNFVEDDKSVSGKIYKYQIGLKKKNNNIVANIKEWDYTTSNWEVYKSWTFEGLTDAYIYEKCEFEATNENLICAVEFQLLDSSDNNVYTLSLPFYFKTKLFVIDDSELGTTTYGYVDRINERICYKNGDAGNELGTNHCSMFLNINPTLNTPYKNANSISYKKRYSEVPGINSLTDAHNTQN